MRPTEVAVTGAAPGAAATWIAAARLRTLPAAVVPVVVGTACAAAIHVAAPGPALAALGGALATAILVVNNLRDRATDVRAGKRTLAVRFGRRAALGEYAALLAIAYAVPLGLALCGRPWAGLPIASAPMAYARLRAVIAADDGPAFNRCLAATAQLLLLHGALFAIGLAAG